MRPALRYHGGKWNLAPWIIQYFPKHRIYTEAYGGAVLLRKSRSYAEIYNDLDGEIVNVFQVLRDSGPALQEQLRLTPFSRSEYFSAYEPSELPIERARRTIIKSFMGFGSDSIRKKSGFRSDSNRSGTTPAHDWANYADVFPQLIDRFRSVVVENRPALEVIAKHDTIATLHYVDPPYVHSTRSAMSSKAYRFEMTDEDHANLSKLLHRLKGNVIVSGYASTLYCSLYKGWKIEKREALADGARKRIEVLWIKPTLSTATGLF
jgi:DNA adenine methylase